MAQGSTPSLDRQRGILTMIKGKFPGTNPAPGFLRSEIFLENGQNNYLFPVLRDNNTQSGSIQEQLQTNDAFVATHMALGIIADDSTAPGTHIPFFYPNKTEFTIGNVNVNHLEAVFSGKLKLTVKETVHIPSLDTRRFRSIPGIQKSSADNHDEGDYMRNMFPLTPSVILYGNQKVEVQLSIPAFANQLIQNSKVNEQGQPVDANRKTKVVLFLNGFLVQNGSMGAK